MSKNYILVCDILDDGMICLLELFIDFLNNFFVYGILCVVFGYMMMIFLFIFFNLVLVDYFGIFLEFDWDWWFDELCIVLLVLILSCNGDDL